MAGLLSNLVGSDNLRGLYQVIYNVTIKVFQRIGPNLYVPTRSEYKEEEDFGVVPELEDDGDGLSEFISKPREDLGSGDSFTFALDEEANGRISGTILLTLSNDSTLSDQAKLTGLAEIVDYGISKIQHKLERKIKESLEDKLLAGRFVFVLHRLRIGAQPFGALVIAYNVSIIDEESVQPGGREYREVKKKTLIGK